MTEPDRVPELSICIPTYNRAEMLEYCLENLLPLKETGLDFEVVIADNASTDRTPDVCREMGKKLNIRYFRQERNVGAYYNNLAVHRLSRGEFVSYLSDDDKYRHDVFLEHLNYLRGNPNVLAAYSSWDCIDDETGDILHGYFNVSDPRQFKLRDAVDLIKFLMLGLVHPEIGIFRSKALHRVMHIEQGQHYTCYNLLYQLLHYGDVAFLPGCFYLEVAKPRRKFGKEQRLNHAILRDDAVEMVAGELEVMMHRILLDFGHLQLPQEQRYQFFEFWQHFVHVRKVLSHDANMAFKNYIKASRMFHRAALWKEMMPLEKALDHSRILYPLVGLQAASDIFRANSTLKRFVIQGFLNVDLILQFYRDTYPDIPVEPLSLDAVRALPNPESVMVLCAKTADREALAAEGRFLPGFVINFNDLCRLYQAHPADGDIEY